jgi:hypothetical protein
MEVDGISNLGFEAAADEGRPSFQVGSNAVSVVTQVEEF